MSRPVDAWTATQLAAAADSPSLGVLDAEQILDTCVFDGTAVRITSGDMSFYVAGSLAEVLDSIGASPVTADEVAIMRARIRGYDEGLRAARGGRHG